MSNQELIQTIGGASINATWLNAIARGIQLVYDIGRGLGTAVRMLIKGSRC